MNGRKNLALASLLSLAVAAATAAQDGAQDKPAAPQPSPTQEKQAREAAQPLVKHDVLVTDGKGRPIADLKREDLRVFDEGVEQALAYFSKDTLPVSYGLVVDNSGSLRSQMEAVIASGRLIVSHNAPEDETFVIRFVAFDRINMMQDFTSDAARLQRALDAMYVEGGQTALVDAVYLAAEHLLQKSKPSAGHTRRRALVLISDGEDRKSHFKLDELLKLLKGTDIQIFAIGLVGALDKERGFTRPSKREQATSLLTRLADETGGLAYQVKTGEELVRAVTEVTGLLHTQHVVGYAPPADPPKKSFRKVEVKLADTLKGSDRKAHTRPAYAVPGAQNVEAKKKEK